MWWYQELGPLGGDQVLRVELMRKTRVAESPLALSSTQGHSENIHRHLWTRKKVLPNTLILGLSAFTTIRNIDTPTMALCQSSPSGLRHPRIPQWTLCSWQPELLPTPQRRERVALCNSGSPFWIFHLWTWIYPSSPRAQVTSFIHPYLIPHRNLH